MTLSRYALTLLLTLLLAAGCSDDTTDNPADIGVDSATADIGTAGDTGGTKDTKAAADRGKSFSFGIQFRNNFTGAYLSGVKVCIQGTSTCVTAQGTGITSRANVILPTDKDSVLLCTFKDYIPMALFVGKDNTEPSSGMLMFPTTSEAKIGTEAKVTIDSTKAMLLIGASEALGGGYGNATLELKPSSGSGPMAADKEGYPDPTTAKTGSLGVALAWYFNVNTVDSTLQVKDNEGNICDVFIGWKDTSKTTATAKLKPVAGHINVMAFRCKEQTG